MLSTLASDKSASTMAVADSPLLLHTPRSLVMLLAWHQDGSEYEGVDSDDFDFRKQEFVPPVKDPSWPPLTAALLEYLALAPQTIDEIVIWGRARKHTGSLIRHMLAYLSFTGKVHYVPAEALWRAGPEPKETFRIPILDTSPTAD